jgi:hypothetical protein
VAPSVPNPNWPSLFAEGQFANNPYYGTGGGAFYYTDMSPRLYKGWSVQRGKQFELDQVQPGEFHGQWVNTDGYLDPSNTGSPYANTGTAYAPGLVPYRGYRIRTQYPPAVNMLTGDQATGGEVTPLATGTAGSTVNISSAYNMPVVTASGTAFQGTQVWQSTGTTGSTGSPILYVLPTPVLATPGTPYTFTARVRSVTVGANPTVQPQIAWISNNSVSVGTSTGSTAALTGATSAAWTTITVSGTVPGPSGANYPAGAQLHIMLTVAPGGSWSFQADGLQLELGASASTFAAPGPSYPLYSGLIERYPQSWDYAGSYGVVSPVCVDTMALLSQTILKEAFVEEVNLTTPQFLFMLNDPSGATTFAEVLGRTPAATIFNSGYGAGGLTPGQSLTAAIPTGIFYGAEGPVVTFNSTGGGFVGSSIDLRSAGITGPGNTGNGFARMVAFRTTSVLSQTYASGNTDYNVGGVSSFSITSNNSGFCSAFVANSSFSISVTNSTFNVLDGNWHLAVMSLSADGKTLSLWVDDVLATNTSAGNATPSPTTVEAIGPSVFPGVGYTSGACVADVAHYGGWARSMTDPEVDLIFIAWATAGSGESSDARYSRILRYANYLGPQSLGSGTTRTMGPANDIAGTDALTSLQNVVNTENGRHFVSGSGTLTFQSRSHDFLSATPVWTFGENQAGGEIPYVDLQFDFDPTRISNGITVTESGTNQSFFAADAVSQAAYGERSFSRTSQCAVPEEVRSSAYFYLSRYKDPHLRVQSLKVDAAANPALFPSVLAFELGQRIRINRRDQFGVRPTITMDGFIEQINHTADDKGAWVVDLQVSPVPPVPYAVFSDLRTTLNNSPSAGATSITLNALPDAATNVARSNLTGGQQLLVGSGATQEVVTIAVGGVASTSVGYSTVVVTLSSGLSFSHTAGQAVVENPGTNNDTLATLGSIQFCY